MPTIVVKTFIAAEPAKVFDMARDVDLHAKSASGNEEVRFASRRLLELNDEVEFEASHFGIRRRLRARITAYDRPHRFIDEQQSGPFRRLHHLHEFNPVEGGTEMIDTFDFDGPCAWVVAPYLKRFLRQRGLALKRFAESSASG